MNRDALLALRDLVISALELPPEEEATPAGHEALNVGLELMFSQGAQTVANRPRPAPQQRPAVLALMPPANGVPCWVIFRNMPAQDKRVDITSAKAGYPVSPLNLNVGGKTYKIHVGNTFIPADAWDGAVPDELEAEYTSGAITLHQPGEPAPNEPMLLLWSRARSIAFGQDKLSHGDAAKARPQVAAELARIASIIPASSGAMSDSVKKLASTFAPDAPYTGAKNDSPAEQRRVARLAAEAKRKAILAGDLDPDDAELEFEPARSSSTRTRRATAREAWRYQ